MIYDFNERKNTLLYKNISLTLYSRKGWCFCGVWDIYSERGLLLTISSSGSQGCQHLHLLASSSETPLISCVSLARLWFSALCLNLTAWFSSRGLLPVTHLFDLSTLILLSCLLITKWQLVKAHGVTRNEPKIHGICDIKLRCRSPTCKPLRDEDSPQMVQEYLFCF